MIFIAVIADVNQSLVGGVCPTAPIDNTLHDAVSTPSRKIDSEAYIDLPAARDRLAFQVGLKVSHGTVIHVAANSLLNPCIASITGVLFTGSPIAI